MAKRKARILCVDDDRPTTMVISGVLAKQGYEVDTAFDGVEGLNKARAWKPDLLILDIMMPQMDGYQVSQRLRNDPDTAGIGIIMLTAKGGLEKDANKAYEFATRVKDTLQGYDTGAVEFLTKPVKANQLVKKVQAFLWTAGFAAAPAARKPGVVKRSGAPAARRPGVVKRSGAPAARKPSVVKRSGTPQAPKPSVQKRTNAQARPNRPRPVRRRR